MRLLRLELQGFKSFLDRTILTFESGITGVVGPNGCGKSNIVDAIMWVMGEQSPKHLRGESMSDVIFNGSDSKAPTSMAEVSLVMDRKGVPLSPQFAAFDKADEISITRRIYRDGTGEFLINKTACRLKDIHELFMDTGVGRRAYSIIEQGQIDRMINVKPEDRRSLFEEVAGITKYKQRRKEAERKLELTSQNILRLQDITSELEKQIRSLKIQATKARKFKEIKSELEVSDLHLLGRDLFNRQLKITSAQSERDAFLSTRSYMDAQFSKIDAESTELEVLKIDQEKQEESLVEREKKCTLKIQDLEKQQSLSEERKKFIKQTSESMVQEQIALNARAEELASELLEQDTACVEARHRLKQLEIDFAQKEEDILRVQDKIRLIDNRKRDAETLLSSAVEEEVYLNSQAQHNRARQEEVSSDRSEIEINLSESMAVLEEYRSSIKATEDRIIEAANKSREAEERVAATSSRIQAISSELSIAEESLYKSKEIYHAKNSRLESLKELQQNLEGYSATAKEVLLTIAEDAPSAIPLAEVLQPSPELEDQLEILLGAEMNTLLVSTEEEAEILARLIEERGLEQVRIVAISQCLNSIKKESVHRELTCVLDKVSVKSGYEVIAQKWLGNVYLCLDAEQVFNMRRMHPGDTFFALSTNIMAHSGGSITSGSVQRKMGVFARRREIEELSVLCAELSDSLNRLTLKREELMKELRVEEDKHTELKDSMSRIHIEGVEHRKEREKIQSLLSRTERDFESLSDDLHRNQAQMEALVSQSVLNQTDLSRILDRKKEIQSELGLIESEIAESDRNLEQAKANLNDEKIEKSRLIERVSGLNYRIEKINSEISQSKARLNTIRIQLQNDEAELCRLETNISQVIDSGNEMQKERSHMLVSLADIQSAFNDTCSRLQELREKKDKLQKERSDLSEKLQDYALKIAEEQSQIDQLKGICGERYHCELFPISEDKRLDISQLPILASTIEVTWDLLLLEEQEALLQSHVQELRNKIDRYGEVNLTAIQEFEEVQKRYEFLSEQRQDLDNSIKILQEAIHKIDDSTKTRFSETFEVVNQKFQEIFPILFNGGKAELSLTNADNLLESGVDVLVQPPGKRLQSITLLSGGEKALTAVSLILAIFARKPSPFCLLDEVDAPLDDANVSRFNTVIRKMAEKTQFIVITHNKKTMEIAEALYGVTMERAGISKMTSVRMS